MKRILFIVGFGLLGLVFVFLVQSVVVDFLDHGEHQYESGSDERGEHELKTLFVAGPLFVAIWAWIGNASFKNRRKGMAMLAAVVLAAIICFGVPGLHGPLANIFDFSGNSLGLAAWGLVSALVTGISARIFGRAPAIQNTPPSELPGDVEQT